MTSVDAVAEALRTWFEDEQERQGFNIPTDYLQWFDVRELAVAAIEALGLEEEWGATLDDDPGEEPDAITEYRSEAEEWAAERCQSCDHCPNAFPKHVVSRFVSPWVATECE
jgi:hypothetical protein